MINYETMMNFDEFKQRITGKQRQQVNTKVSNDIDTDSILKDVASIIKDFHESEVK